MTARMLTEGAEHTRGLTPPDRRNYYCNTLRETIELVTENAP